MSLLAALPARNRLERVDVPADQFRKGSRALPQPGQLGRILELNSQPDRLDLDDLACRRAKEAGVRVAVNSDAHGAGELDFVRFGVDQARRGWLEPGDVVNTLPLPALLETLTK